MMIWVFFRQAYKGSANCRPTTIPPDYNASQAGGIAMDRTSRSSSPLSDPPSSGETAPANRSQTVLLEKKKTQSARGRTQSRPATRSSAKLDQQMDNISDRVGEAVPEGGSQGILSTHCLYVPSNVRSSRQLPCQS